MGAGDAVPPLPDGAEGAEKGRIARKFLEETLVRPTEGDERRRHAAKESALHAEIAALRTVGEFEAVAALSLTEIFVADKRPLPLTENREHPQNVLLEGAEPLRKDKLLRDGRGRLQRLFLPEGQDRLVLRRHRKRLGKSLELRERI